MTFPMLPPETNSARMYMGPGSAPLLAAAAAWEGLAAQLGTTAAHFGAVVDGLTATWLGPSSLAMMTSASLYQTWLMLTAEQAEQTAGQAMAAAAAYEAAFVATVNPAEVLRNRATLATLVATNFLGLNTPAILATEAEYAEMWAQDVAAMFTYQAASMSATQLSAWEPLKPLTTGVNQSPVSPGGSNNSGGVQGVLSGLQGFDPNSGWSGLFNLYGEALVSSAPYDMPTNILSLFTNMWVMGQVSSAAQAAEAAAMNASNAVAAGPAAGDVAVTIGSAPSIGGLSVPQSWGTAVEQPVGVTVKNATPILPETELAPAAPLTPMPLMAAGKGGEPQRPRYGTPAKYVIPRHPSAG